MARKTDKKTEAEEWQGSPFASEEIEFSPFMFDAGQDDAGQEAASTASGSGVPPAPGGQFSDADMEFEPFMFDQGTGVPPFTPTTDSSAPDGSNFAPFSTSPFGDPAGSATSTVASTGTSTVESADKQTTSGPITGSDLPLPSYLASDQTTPSTDSAPLTPETRAESSSVDTTAEGTSTTSNLAPPTDPALALPKVAGPDMGMGTGEQLTGRAPSGPLAELPDTPSSPSTSTSPSLTSTSPTLGRVRGNTGPLGPLPPDRTGAPNTSWSDSSLASIEDFSSILIALHAGKKLRQSGPLNEGMLAQSPSASSPTAPAEDAGAAPDTSVSAAPASTPEHMGIATQVQNMPEWAVQATQSSPLTPEMSAPSAQATVDAPFPATDLDESAPQSSVAAHEPAAEAQADSADSIQYRQIPADSVLNQLEPNVAEALKSMNHSVAPDSLSGDELEFEGFMFNKGASTPMASLSTPSPEELASMSKELGPAFDPAPYAGADTAEAEVEEPVNYNDMNPALFEGLSATAQPQAVGEPGADADVEKGLPFWLQFDNAPPASGPLAEEDLPEQYRMSDASARSSAAQNAQADQGARSESNDFAELPPIEPFDFSLMPTSDTNESLGFNTGELSGLISDAQDPMTATINLAAVAALLGGTTSGPLDTTSPSLASSGERDSGSLPESETSLSLDTPESWSSAPQGDQTDPFQYTSEGWEASSDYSSSAPTDLEAEESSPRPSWSQDVAPELGLDAEAYSDTNDYSASTETPTTQMDASGADQYEMPSDLSPEPVTEPVQVEPVDAASVLPTDSSLVTGGWMASATPGLTMDSVDSSDDDLAQNTTGLADEGFSAEQGLAVEELDVAPFDLTQIEVEEEPPTGYLDAQGMQKNYGTANLERTADSASSLGANPADSNWISEHDTSLFTSVPPTEGEHSSESARVTTTTSFTAPLSPDSTLEGKGSVTDYLGEDAVSEAQPQAIEVPETPDAPEEAQPMIKARVARGPWTSYNETTDFTMPAPQAHTQAQAKAQQPAPQDHTQAHAEVQQPVPAASESSSLLFEQSVRLPGDIDIMTSGPLPSVAGFEDLVGWVADNPQDIGAHMALASAYAQSEDLDSALRVYRRIIKKPTTSDTTLKVIWDELSDLSPQAQHLPRFHQLSGDLLLRLGRHREAVEAYNKLQP